MFVCNPASLQVEKGEDIFWCFRTVKQLVDVNITKDMPRVQNFLFSTKLIFFLFDIEEVLFQPSRRNKNWNLSKCK